MDKQWIVCIGFPKWKGDYLKSTVQLMEALADKYHILYIDYTYTLKDVFKGVLSNKRVPVKKILGLENRLEHLPRDNGNNIYILTLPPSIPINWIDNPSIFNALLKINTGFVLPTILSAFGKLNIERPIVINAFHPILGIGLKGKLGEKRVIYYCYDEISAAPWICKHGNRFETEYMKLVDAVITSSTGLKKTKTAIQPKTYLVRNGVDTKLFGRKKSRLRGSSGTGTKINIGYLGSLDERLDIELLQALIKESPEFNYTFVGRIVESSGARVLAQYPNVHLAGPCLPDTLAAFVDQMDVCLIPFKCNSLTSGIYPLKINEYLMRGKAVVTTEFADLSDFYHLIYQGSNAEEFLAQIRLALAQDNPIIREKRMKHARENSWESRAEQMDAILQSV
jgi:glycosyltransferase involved in cell wall biosynthesis